jgi:hypothetical protein
MPDFEIKIKTDVDDKGIKQTTEGLKNVGAASEGTAGKIDEGFKIFGHGAHEAHAALHALGDAFPGIGHATPFQAPCRPIAQPLHMTLSSPKIAINSRTWHQPGRLLFQAG